MPRMHEGKQRYWFPAKRYGWGWGFPLVWQGWVTLLSYVGVIALGAHVFPPAEKTPEFIVMALSVSVVLTVIAWARGEPPRWRWGKK